jgi:hypothetical protein
MSDEYEFNVKPPKTDAAKMDEYVRRLRMAWLNPSDEASQMAVYNYENRIAPEFVRKVLARIVPRSER